MKNIVKAFIIVVGLSFAAPATQAQVSVGLSVRVGPPAIPVYAQPPCPADGYLWTPGYWAYGDDGYYWVPGVWVRPPHFGLLWTPGYWGYNGGFYGFHEGYWGRHVGFYGGINYGFGYGGAGFYGGGWNGNVFRYNTAVVNVNRTVVRNVYVDRTVINNTTINNHVSFNGPGGVNAQPRPEERAAMNEHHVQPTAQQFAHQSTASHDRNQFASVNKGQPSRAAMNRVNGRSFNQQGRIANGVASGKLTPHETGRLENHEANVNGEVRADRHANGGTLTPQEHQRVNRQQNNVSHDIYRDKHNANNAPRPHPMGGGARPQGGGGHEGGRRQ